MELQLLLATFRRWAWLLILGGILGAGLGYLFSLYQKPVYEASTKFMVMQNTPDSLSELSNFSDQELAQTYIQLLTTKPVLDAVEDNLGDSVSSKQISAEVVQGTRLLKVTVRDNSAQHASEIANELINVIILFNDSLQRSHFASTEESLQIQIQQLEEQMAQIQDDIFEGSQVETEREIQNTGQEIIELEGTIIGRESKIQLIEQELQNLNDPGQYLPQHLRKTWNDAEEDLDQLEAIYAFSQQAYAGQLRNGQNRNIELEQQLIASQEEISNLEDEIDSLKSEYLPQDLINEKSVELQQLQFDNDLDRERLTALRLNQGNINNSQGDPNQQNQAVLSLYQTLYGELLNTYEIARLARLQNTPNLVQVELAETPSAPILPNFPMNIILGTALCLILAGSIAFLIEYLDDTIKSPSDIERLSNVPVMASVGHLKNENDEPGSELVTIHQPRDPSSEAFRDLRTALLFSAVDKPNGTIVVTSANPSEGKSTVAANLAVVLAQAGHNVLLVDCDLRRPRQSTVFGRPNHTGLSMLLLEFDPKAEASKVDAAFSNAIQPVSLAASGSNLWLMTSGPIPPNPSELLGSEKMKYVLDQLSTRYDYVIIDTPPALIVTDPYVMSMRADGVIMVVSAGSTRHNDIVNSVSRFKELRAPILGAVLNNKSSRTGSYYYYKDEKPYYQQNRGSTKVNRRQAFLRRLGFGKQ